MEKQIPRYFIRLSALLKTSLLKSSPSVSINEEEEADADDLTSEGGTLQNLDAQRSVGGGWTVFLKRGEGTAAVRLQKIQTFASYFYFKFIVIANKTN